MQKKSKTTNKTKTVKTVKTVKEKKFPKVIIHNAVSADGRLDWFTPDVEQFYDIISIWNEDATLVGSDTMCNAIEEIPPEEDDVFEPPQKDPKDDRPILAVVDSTGKVRNWHVLKKAGYWREMVALCSKTTPKEYLKYLKDRHINYIIIGKDKVDLKSGLVELQNLYKIKTVRIDSGGTLNGIMLRNGLVDEISMLIYPNFVGGLSPRSIFRAHDLTSSDDVIDLKLIGAEKLKGNVIWLRYKVKK